MASSIPNTERLPIGRFQQGFNYPMLLAAMVIAGILLAGIGEVWHIAAIREKETQLLFVGGEFRQAIGRYYELTPSGPKQYPQSLDDLLLDRRFPRAVRHLRKLYPDPFLGKPDWVLVLEQGRVIGVYSQTEGTPMRKRGVEAAGAVGVVGGNAAAGEALSYAEWRFVYRPENVPVGGVPIAPTGTVPNGGAPVTFGHGAFK